VNVETVGPLRLRRWDLVVMLWVGVWLVAGLLTWNELWQLTALSDSVVDSGNALRSAGKALQDVSQTPFVGGRLRELGDQVSVTAAGVVHSGQTAESSIRRLSVLVGAAVALGPSGPVLVAYLPSRRLWKRQAERTRDARLGGGV
jgi:hypothetical protein